MGLRWKARSTTPGDRVWTEEAVSAIKGEQLVVDQGVVALRVGDIVADTGTLLGQTPTFDLDLAEQAAAAGQLVIDTAAVEAGKADIKSTRTILTVGGTLDMGLYALISDIVAVDNVVDGVPRYTGGSTGIYPTTATSQAAQLVTDQAAVTVEAGYLLTGHSILGIAGGLDLSDYVLIADVVAAEWVVPPHTTYVGGPVGEFAGSGVNTGNIIGG